MTTQTLALSILTTLTVMFTLLVLAPVQRDQRDPEGKFADGLQALGSLAAGVSAGMIVAVVLP